MKNLKLIIVLFICVFTTSVYSQTSKKDVKLKIKVSEIPNVVVKTLNKKFDNFVADKAYKTKKDNKQAYLISLKKNDIIKTVYIDSKGKIINK